VSFSVIFFSLLYPVDLWLGLRSGDFDGVLFGVPFCLVFAWGLFVGGCCWTAIRFFVWLFCVVVMIVDLAVIVDLGTVCGRVVPCFGWLGLF
jgi:hypothetical protein